MASVATSLHWCFSWTQLYLLPSANSLVIVFFPKQYLPKQCWCFSAQALRFFCFLRSILGYVEGSLPSHNHAQTGNGHLTMSLDLISNFSAITLIAAKLLGTSCGVTHIWKHLSLRDTKASIRTRSYTKSVDALWDQPANLQDAAGRICPKHFCFPVAALKIQENAQPYQHLKPLNSWKMPNHKRDMTKRWCILQILSCNIPFQAMRTKESTWQLSEQQIYTLPVVHWMEDLRAISHSHSVWLWSIHTQQREVKLHHIRLWNQAYPIWASRSKCQTAIRPFWGKMLQLPISFQRPQSGLKFPVTMHCVIQWQDSILQWLQFGGENVTLYKPK